MSTEFGKRLKLARKHAGLTQKDLAPLVGMSQSNLSELETRAHESGKTVQLARACAVDAYWLATGEGQMLVGSALHVAEAPRAYRAMTINEALPMVLNAFVALSPLQMAAVMAMLDELQKHPEMCDDACVEILPKLLAPLRSQPSKRAGMA